MERLHRAASRAITGCLPLVLPYLSSSLRGLFISPASRPDSFHSFVLWTSSLSPRLCRSSRRAFASTYLLMFPSTSLREALLACLLFPPWNLPSFIVESILTSTCSRSDLPLSRQGAALAHLDSLPPHDLVLWTDGSVPFPVGKGSYGVLANCSLCGTEATLFFSVDTVCSSFSAEACAILHALCWSWQRQQVCHFSSPPIWLSLCPLLHLSSYLKLCGRSGRKCLLSPPVLSDYNGSLNTHFSRGTTWLMSWPDGERYLRPPQSLVVSLLLSLVSNLLFSWARGVLSHLNSLTDRFPFLGRGRVNNNSIWK